MGRTSTSDAQKAYLQYLDSHRVDIDGVSCGGMTIRRATGKVLGKLQGFLVDPVAHQLKYMVVNTSTVFGRTKLLPFASARLDAAHRAIEVLAGDLELQTNRDSFSPFSDEQLLHT